MTLHALYRGVWNSPGVFLSALIVLVTLTGCHSGGSGGGCTALPCLASLGGNLSGLVGSRLILQNNQTSNNQTSASFQTLGGQAANGPNAYFGNTSFNTAYDLTVAAQPNDPSQTCVVANGTGTAHGADPVTNIRVTCTTESAAFHVCG